MRVCMCVWGDLEPFGGQKWRKKSPKFQHPSVSLHMRSTAVSNLRFGCSTAIQMEKSW